MPVDKQSRGPGEISANSVYTKTEVTRRLGWQEKSFNNFKKSYPFYYVGNSAYLSGQDIVNFVLSQKTDHHLE